MQVSHDGGTKLVNHKVIEYADRTGNLIASEYRKHILPLPVAGTRLRIKLARSRWLILAGLFFFCLFIDQDRVEVHKQAKKRTRLISIRTSSVNKGFIYLRN